MGQIKNSKIIIVIFCLIMISFVMFWLKAPTTRQRVKNVSLAETMTRMGPWHNAGDIPLADNVIAELKLDDFIYRNFSNGREALSLYIGYYNSRKKVGAAHSPLVCFTGQGWGLSDFNIFSLKIGNENIKLASMIITKGEEKQFIFYWFQAFDKTSPGTLMQKVDLLLAKVLHSGEDNAFVRVVIPYGRVKSMVEARDVGKQFIEYFYPVFKDYIMS